MQQSPGLRSKPRPHRQCMCPGIQWIAIHVRLHSGLKSVAYNSSTNLSLGEWVQMSYPLP